MRTKQEIIDWVRDVRGVEIDSVPWDKYIMLELLLDIRELLNGGPV